MYVRRAQRALKACCVGKIGKEGDFELREKHIIN